MTSKQRAYLRSLANTIKPVYQIGKNGLNDNQIEAIDSTLEARELIKINTLVTTPEDINDIANEIATKTNCDIVQIMGNKITLYRKAKKNSKIEFLIQRYIITVVLIEMFLLQKKDLILLIFL